MGKSQYKLAHSGLVTGHTMRPGWICRCTLDVVGSGWAHLCQLLAGILKISPSSPEQLVGDEVLTL